jgi:linoleoyl-CoA desaturase
MIKPNTLTFAKTGRDFTTTLNQRVNQYFKDNNISRHGNNVMVIKTIFMFSMYLIPYGLILSGLITSGWIIIPLLIIMSLGLAGIGLSIMHDANHGAYSKKPWVNTLLGYSLNMVGASSFTWKLQHNVLHHTYTNVHDHDEDISPRGVLRMTPHSPWKSIHKFQAIYAWFLYGLMTIVWMILKDFVRTVHYHKTGLAKAQKADIRKEWMILIATKLVYVSYIFVLPLLLTPFSWWMIVLGILGMHYIAGFLLAIIFQPAHVIEGTEFPMPDDNNELENNWAIHQLHTTTNFANKSKWFSWYVGGLNYQIEHHLFPNVCHVHYSKISNIVKETAQEFGLPYKSARTFMDALSGHARLLYELGKKPQPVLVHANN